MRDLPLNGRNFEQLILLAPGAVSYPAGGQQRAGRPRRDILDIRLPSRGSRNPSGWRKPSGLVAARCRRQRPSRSYCPAVSCNSATRSRGISYPRINPAFGTEVLTNSGSSSDYKRDADEFQQQLLKWVACKFLICIPRTASMALIPTAAWAETTGPRRGSILMMEPSKRETAVSISAITSPSMSSTICPSGGPRVAF
jgi:hypothetical protein